MPCHADAVWAFDQPASDCDHGGIEIQIANRAAGRDKRRDETRDKPSSACNVEDLFARPWRGTINNPANQR